MKIGSIVESILKRAGFMRIADHEAKAASIEKQVLHWESYSKKLGVAANKAGVKVIFDGERISGIKLDGPVFVHGDRIVIDQCTIWQPPGDHALVLSPSARDCMFSLIKFIGPDMPTTKDPLEAQDEFLRELIRCGDTHE